MKITSCVSALLCAALTALPAAASTIVYQTTLAGANENPANGSTATGSSTVTVDDIANTLRLEISFSGLAAVASAAHIHCCIAPPTNQIVAVPAAGFPSTTSGTYDQTFDMTLPTSYNSAFITANGGTEATAFAALLVGLNAGQGYVNIHNSIFPGGEIRGYLSAVPLPGALALLATALAGVGPLCRRRLTR